MQKRRWDDLGARLGSAVAMIVVGTGAVWLGGDWFHALVALVCAVMVWELVCLLDPGHRRTQYILGAAAALAALAAIELPPALALPLLLVPSALGLLRLRSGRMGFAVYTAVILFAGFGMMALRDDFGLIWMTWLILVVVVTDVAGYFAGRLLGGPKLWPRVSPKKTWSGTLAGWAGAAFVGAVYVPLTGAGLGLVAVSVAASMASQVGDIAESAVKRRVGVKDSSQLLPGHGGALDRFDGMLAASVFLLVMGQILVFPPGTG
jgi:phosphatidate cytidylyltransferase